MLNPSKEKRALGPFFFAPAFAVSQELHQNPPPAGLKAFSDDLLEHVLVMGKSGCQPAYPDIFSSSCRSFRTCDGIRPPNHLFLR